jgi:hypothetical protein
MITYARESVPSGAIALAKLLMNNLQAQILHDNSSFKNKAIQWYCDLLLNQNNKVDDMIGIKNGILVAYGMCLPCEPPFFLRHDPNLPFLIVLLLSLVGLFTALKLNHSKQ